MFIVYTISIALCSMSLALGIASRQFRKAAVWNAWYVVFQACILGAVFFDYANKISFNFFNPLVSEVFHYVFRIWNHVIMGFMIVLIPYFLRWITGDKWGKKQRLFTYPAGIIYFGLGLTGSLTKNGIFENYIQTPLFIVVYGSCIINLWGRIHRIEDENSRNTALTINIVSLCLIPTIALSYFFPLAKDLSYPVYSMAFSIIMLVFFYNRFDVDAKKLLSAPVLDMKALEKYNITDREFEVVQQICDGLTNKEIASKLCISVNTVNNHVANIFDKMGVRSRIDLLKILKEGPWA